MLERYLTCIGIIEVKFSKNPSWYTSNKQVPIFYDYIALHKGIWELRGQ